MIRILARSISGALRASTSAVVCSVGLALAPAGLLAPSRIAHAAEDPNAVTLNFVNADIQAVIKAVAEITGRNILIDPRVTGTVNIVAPKPVPRDMVFSILLSSLRAQGFAAVGGDLGFVRIVPEAEAKFYPGVTDPRRARGDQVVTEVFQLQYESAQQLVPILRPLVSPNNVINAFPASNTLIVTDYAENLRRIRRVVASVDQPAAGELVSIKLNNAAAVDVAQTVARLIPEAAAPVQPGVNPKIAITVDSRTNSLLVRADNPNLAARIRTLATTLDAPTAQPGNIHVVYLKNAEAIKVAEVLRAILTGQASTTRTSTSSTGLSQGGIGGFGATAPGGQQQQPGLAPPGAPGAASPSTQFGAGAFGATGFGPGSSSTTATGAGSTVQAYPETNSVVIIAPDSVYNMLRATIDKLDARRAQVYVEALIVEVTSTKSAEFGIQWQDLARANGVGIIGGTNFGGAGTNIIGAAQNIGSVGAGLNLGVVRGSITINGTKFLNLAALARALEADSTTNILSSPNLMTLDNEEAKIIVGQNIPIVTGSFTLNTTGGTGGTNPFQTFERRDVGLTLRVKPSVAEGGSVKLALYQEVSSIQDRSNPSGIITNKRSMESTVLIDDGQTIVLGGLISDDVQGTEQRVPILGNIPVIGSLFRYTNRTQNKTNLLVFLRPVIVRDSEAAFNLTGDRYEYIRGANAAQTLPARAVLPEMPSPNIAPMERMQPRPPARAPQPQRPATSANELDIRQSVLDSQGAGAPAIEAPAADTPVPAPISKAGQVDPDTLFSLDPRSVPRENTGTPESVAAARQAPTTPAPVPAPLAPASDPAAIASRLTAPAPIQTPPALSNAMPNEPAPVPMSVVEPMPVPALSRTAPATQEPVKTDAATKSKAAKANERRSTASSKRDAAATRTKPAPIPPATLPVASQPLEVRDPISGVVPRSYEPRVPIGQN